MPPEHPKDERDADRLRRSTTPDAMSVELVSSYAGDCEMTDAESERIRSLQDTRGTAFYSDLLYAISHQYFAPEIAEDLWGKVLLHKHTISERLGRNVRITVATLDYLSNITKDLVTPTLISEVYVSELASLSMHDGLTGLFNHSSCYEILELQFRSRRRYGLGLSLILLDIDDFKSVNDRSGHQEGDRILVELARTLEEKTRESDICCRFGGEEFVIILPLTSAPDEACAIGERIRENAACIRSGEHRITISAGVAMSDPATTTPHALVEKADRALYRAKSGGKNQVVLGIGR